MPFLIHVSLLCLQQLVLLVCRSLMDASMYGMKWFPTVAMTRWNKPLSSLADGGGCSHPFTAPQAAWDLKQMAGLILPPHVHFACSQCPDSWSLCSASRLPADLQAAWILLVFGHPWRWLQKQEGTDPFVLMAGTLADGERSLWRWLTALL